MKDDGSVEEEKRIKIYADITIGISGIIPDGQGVRVPLDDSAEIGRVIAEKIKEYKKGICPEILENTDDMIVLRIDS